VSGFSRTDLKGGGFDHRPFSLFGFVSAVDLPVQGPENDFTKLVD
jgi:hypothetical protein